MPPTVHARDVTNTCSGDGYGVSRISLQVSLGHVVLLSGPSGSGKSTQARCLSGLIPHLCRGTRGGAVRLTGLSTASTALWRLTEQAGLVLQNPSAQMLNVTIEEEIVFGLENLGVARPVITERLEGRAGFFAHLAEKR